MTILFDRVFVGAALALAALTLATAQTASVAGAGEDRFLAGSSLRISDRTPGDLIATAGRLEVGAPVDGDAVLAGGEVRLSAAVTRNVYAAGGRVSIDGELGRHVRAAAGQLELGPNARVAGNATLAGGDLSLRAPVKGSLRIMAGRVLIDSAIDGDVSVAARQIELGPNARIGGALRWRSDSELERHTAAQVAGPVERLALPLPSRERGASSAQRAHEQREVRNHAASWVGAAWWTLGLMLVAAVGVAAAPTLSARVAQTLRERTGWSLLIGFIVLVCVPVAVLILLITVIGAPLALLALLVYLALLPLGYVASAVGLGLWALTRWKAEQAGRTGWRIGAALLALLLLALLGRVPWLGGLVAFAALLAGLGAIVMLVRPGKPAASA